MRLTFLLADSAQVQGGKLYILGGGWNITGPQPSPGALAGIVHVEWGETNREHTLAFDLVRDDGEPFMVPTPMGPQPLHIEMRFETGRPPGIAHGSELNAPFAFNIGPLPLELGRRYEWRPRLDGQDLVDNRLAFSMRQAPPPQAAGGGAMG
jgi:hypothetical protein